MLSFVGLGLWDEKDVTLKGLEEIRRCDAVYAEFYTSPMGVSLENIERVCKKSITVLSREEVEDGTRLLEEATQHNICLLTGGDAMAATTHVDLRLRARELGIETKLVHGVSIVSAAAGALGLQIYKFGRIISIARPSAGFFPLSPYDALRDNLRAGMHSLLLLDTVPKALSAGEALDILLKMERRKKKGVVNDETLVAVVARVSAPDETVRAGFVHDMRAVDMGPPPHAIVIPGALHPVEARALMVLASAPENFFE
jgi:diphthine synthase